MLVQKSYDKDKSKMYIIPTPVGNLEDITIRTLNVLKKIDILYCEDTRVTAKLLNRFELKKTLKTYNDFSFEKESKNILNYLDEGLNIGLVSDAGMPGISDPGYDIIKYLKENQKEVIILPGASAFVLPMVYSTTKSNKFLFYGFLSKHKSTYKKEIKEIIQKKENTIIYESPHRLLKTLENIREENKNTFILIARELTKIYEEYIEGSIEEIYEYFKINRPRGEFILIIYSELDKKEIIEHIDYIEEIKKLEKKGFSTKDAIKEIAKKYEVSKNKLYTSYMKGENR